MNFELKELVRAGVKYLQIDEPYYSGFPEDLPWGVRVLNTLVDGVDARITLHICLRQPLWQADLGGNYRIYSRRFSTQRFISCRSSSRGAAEKTWICFKEFSGRFEIGVGVIDVKDHEVESPELVAERIRKAASLSPSSACSFARLRMPASSAGCCLLQAALDGSLARRLFVSIEEEVNAD
jgi:5-methyltetrahydropteroyltriglutamate--homocysteine methyltransferase